MINIVVPMAGAGKRFQEAGYTVPKPFIKVAGQPMIEKVLANLEVPNANIILLAQGRHIIAYPEVFSRIMKRWQVTIVEVDAVTEGAACTVLLAINNINNSHPLLMANSDQLVDIAIADFIKDSDKRGLAGSILTFFSVDPKWSYVKLNHEHIVTEVKEKVVISDQATVGIYYYREGRTFVEAAVKMIARNERVNNEFYVGPAYNHAISDGAKIGTYHIKDRQMHGLGTPEDLRIYLQQYESISTG
jgi:UDP-N-acetylglucosamine diphosphorylase / glucose-1-phosphate thymidylyltransferase / UDP-N-acetylgalactosamine diphosphorylase / glucosamine-1-phosphate N-acetyltransferase / galactosamine-1-phosphate N-acetyltransferase